MRSRRKQNTRTRSGIATIEFVMSLPFLFVLFAMLYTLSLKKLDFSSVTMRVRNTAWLERSAVEGSTTASAPFQFGDATTGSVEDRSERELRIYPWLGGERKSKNRAFVIAGTWDHVQVPEMRGGKPHSAAGARMVGGAWGSLGSIFGLIDK